MRQVRLLRKMSIAAFKRGAVASALILAWPAICGPVVAQENGASRLVGPALEGYVIGYEQTSADLSIREEVPEGESVEAWSRMVTTQRFAKSEQSALQFAETVKGMVQQSCAQTSMSAPGEIVHQGYKAASFSATCYSEPARGGVETFFMMAVRAPDALLVKQVAFKRDIERADMEFAVAVLRGARVCTGEDCT